MSDEEHHFESKADAGASKTYPQQAGTIRKNGYIVIKGRACKVVEVSTSKTGKHGHAKCHFVGIDIFNTKKLEDIVPSSHNCDVPHLTRTDYQLIDISEDGFVSLLTENGNTKDDLRLPTDETLLAQVVRLYRRKWIEEHTYPHFTMIGQSLGSVYLSWEALRKFTPQFYFDTSGYAFTYPLARIFGCKVICYTHYPTISSDMVSRVLQQSSMYNNDALIAKSMLLSRCKVVYYTLFSWLYGLVGSSAHLAMVNSSWTRSHIESLWKIPRRTKRVYPPCDTSSLQLLPLERPVRSPVIISVAQFRPEKAHGLQLEAFALAVRRLDQDLPRPKLLFVGSCRNKQDEERLQKLKHRSKELSIDDYVEFHRDVMYRDLVQLLGGAVAGLHSMIDEHFGISIVEYMAAGVIPIAHNSAGPKMDIVLNEGGHRTGFLASSKEEYAEAILKVLKMPEPERLAIAAAARKRAQRFSEQKFFEDFEAAVQPILAPKASS